MPLQRTSYSLPVSSFILRLSLMSSSDQTYQPLRSNDAQTLSLNGHKHQPASAHSNNANQHTILAHMTADNAGTPIDVSFSSAPSDASTDEVFIQYPIRWLVLFIFALLTITNAILWICFAPIQGIAASQNTHTQQ